MTYIPTDDATDDWFSLSRVFNGGGKQIFPIEGQTYPLGWDSGFIPEEEGTFILTSSGIKGCTASKSNSISYINGTVSAHGNLILIFDIAGNLVKKGSDSLQTDDLLPGIYIAKAIGSNGTLRINVK